jgi:hypothetical protein
MNRRGNMPRFIHVHPPVHEHLGEGLTLRHICLAQWTDTTGALQGFGADADPPRALLVPPPPPPVLSCHVKCHPGWESVFSNTTNPSGTCLTFLTKRLLKVEFNGRVIGWSGQLGGKPVLPRGAGALCAVCGLARPAI